MPHSPSVSTAAAQPTDCGFILCTRGMRLSPQQPQSQQGGRPRRTRSLRAHAAHRRIGGEAGSCTMFGWQIFKQILLQEPMMWSHCRLTVLLEKNIELLLSLDEVAFFGFRIACAACCSGKSGCATYSMCDLCNRIKWRCR